MFYLKKMKADQDPTSSLWFQNIACKASSIADVYLLRGSILNSFNVFSYVLHLVGEKKIYMQEKPKLLGAIITALW